MNERQPTTSEPAGRALLAREEVCIEGVHAGAGFLLFCPVVVAAFGGLFLTQATLGVGKVCAACFLAVCARISQAGAHHKAVMPLLSRR